MTEMVAKLTFGLGLLALAAGEVSAQTQACAPRAVVVARLADGFGESPQAAGLGAQGQMVEMFASRETGTWTITVTRPGGLTCLVASGDAFEALTQTLPERDEDA